MEAMETRDRGGTSAGPPGTADGPRPASKPSGLAWFIEGPLSAKLAALYEQHVGSLDALLGAGDDLRIREEILAGVRPRPHGEAFDHVRARLTSRLAAHLNRLDGRDEIGRFDWRIFIYAVGSAATLRYALRRAEECLEALDGRLGTMSLRVEDNQAYVAMNSLRAQATVPGCAVDLYGVARIHGLFGMLIDGHLPITALGLDYDEPVFAALSLPDMPSVLRLGKGWTGFAFPAAYLDYPIVCSEERLEDWTRHSFMANSAQTWLDERLPERVRNMVLASLRKQNRVPAFAEVAAHFGLSGATIRRRLARDNVSFREIKDSCRLELALALLRQEKLSIEVIAEKLDFCDSDAFRMAFRSWVGTSPTGYRDSLLHAP